MGEDGKISYETVGQGGAMEGWFAAGSAKRGGPLESIAASPKEMKAALKRDKGNALELEIHRAADGFNQEVADRQAVEAERAAMADAGVDEAPLSDEEAAAADASFDPSEWGAVRQRTKLGDQALIPGTLEAASSPRLHPSDNFADSPLFTQEQDARVRAEEQKNAQAQRGLFDEQARVNQTAAGEAVSTLADVQSMFPRATVEDLGGGRVRVSGQGLEKPVIVQLDKAEVKLRPGTMEQTRGGEMQPGEYVAGRFDRAADAPEAQLEVRAGEGRDSAMHEVTHAIEELVRQGKLSTGDRAALDASARFRALAEARRRGVDWRQAPEQLRQKLLAEARADLVGDYSQIKGPGKVATTPLERALAGVGDFVREARQGGSAGNAMERIRVGDTGESLPSRAGRALHEGWRRASDAVNPLERSLAGKERARQDVTFESMVGEGRTGNARVPGGAEQAGGESAAVRLGPHGEVQREAAGAGAQHVISDEDARDLLRNIQDRAEAEMRPLSNGYHVTPAGDRLVVRDGRVIAAMPMRTTAEATLPAPHVIRDPTHPDGSKAIAFLHRTLRASDEAVGRQTWQNQKDNLSQAGADSWNRRWLRADPESAPSWKRTCAHRTRPTSRPSGRSTIPPEGMRMADWLGRKRFPG